MRDAASKDPGFTIKPEPAGESPPACPQCGAEYVRNRVRHNKNGPEPTYRCKGPKRHRLVFNPGFEGRCHSNKTITRAVRLYCHVGSVRKVADGPTSEEDRGRTTPSPGGFRTWSR